MKLSIQTIWTIRKESKEAAAEKLSALVKKEKAWCKKHERWFYWKASN